jgi:hypothetical protein
MSTPGRTSRVWQRCELSCRCCCVRCRMIRRRLIGDRGPLVARCRMMANCSSRHLHRLIVVDSRHCRHRCSRWFVDADVDTFKFIFIYWVILWDKIYPINMKVLLTNLTSLVWNIEFFFLKNSISKWVMWSMVSKYSALRLSILLSN